MFASISTSYQFFSFLIVFVVYFSLAFCQEQDEHLIVRTLEKLPVHTEVINLRRLFFSSSNSSSENVNVDFSLAKRDEFPYMFFLINHSSRGILTIRKEIDRDDLCRKRRCRCDTWCDLELEIFVTSEQFNIELLTIRILDQNDHSPQFTSGNQPLNLTIVESAPIGAMIKLESAVDYDQGLNGIVGYSLLSSTSLPFSLRYDLLRADLSLVVDESLDRELIPFYQFQILAQDGGNRTGLLNVHITIDDVNDCPPKFEQTIYTLKNVSENLPIGSIVFRVHANDADQGVNGDVTYQLINQKNCFEIDPILGDIRVQCALDYETKMNYRLEIEARDGGEGSKTDFCTLFIHLMDENDNYPMIDFYPNDLPLHENMIKLSLSESLPINSLILSFSIIDRDSGDNGRVTWQLDRAELIPFELIRLTENTGELRTKRTLDREYISEYNLTLDARDHGKPHSKSNRLNIHLILIDENDNAPRFRQENPQITINEHVKINDSNGYEVYRVQAEDFDLGRNSEIIYSILHNENSFFQIDSHTGIIRALIEFDRKEQETYILHIQARDKGFPMLSSETKVFFTIIPRNEHAPNCFMENNRTKFTIIENSKQDILLTRITCFDNDQEGLNGQISVESRWWPDETIPFSILTRKTNRSESSVEILVKVTGIIDRELIPSYTLFLTIFDHGNPRQTTNLSLTIDILDENDHCPQLHIETSFLLINRDITSNDFLIHLIASDNDQGANGEISFELSSSTSPSFVRLHSNGTLFVQTNSTLIRDDSLLVLHIQIRDHGQPTPCLIVETLRLFIGSNRTDWLMVLKNNDEASLRFVKEQFQQGKRMAHVNSISSTSTPLSVSVSTTRKQLFTVFLGSAILISVVIITIILCFVDRLHKKLVKKNSSNSHPYNLGNGKRIASSSPSKTRFGYDDESPTHHYSNLKVSQQPAVSTSQSSTSSSIDSTTRINTAQNRMINPTYSYTAMGTSEELMPMELEESGDDDDDDEEVSSGIQLMMTTV